MAQRAGAAVWAAVAPVWSVPAWAAVAPAWSVPAWALAPESVEVLESVQASSAPELVRRAEQ